MKRKIKEIYHDYYLRFNGYQIFLEVTFLDVKYDLIL